MTRAEFVQKHSWNLIAFSVRRRIGRLIPPIHTLQLDVKYLYPYTDVLRKLILGQRQYSSITYAIASEVYPFRHSDVVFLSKLKQLHLFVMQNIVHLTIKAVLREDRAEIQAPGTGKPGLKVWLQLVVKAQCLGLDGDLKYE